MQWKRVFGTASIGLGAMVWALAQAAKGDWAFFALAGVLALATNLTIVEIFERPLRTATVRAVQPGRMRDDG